MTIYSLNVTYPTGKLYGHLDLIYWITADGLLFFNSTFEIFEDLGKQKTILQMFVPKSDADQNFDRLYFQSSTDLCKLLKDAKANYFMRAFMEGYEKAAHKAVNCTFDI